MIATISFVDSNLPNEEIELLIQYQIISGFWEIHSIEGRLDADQRLVGAFVR